MPLSGPVKVRFLWREDIVFLKSLKALANMIEQGFKI